MWLKGFHGGSAVIKHSPAMQKTIYKVGDVGFIPALRRSPGEGNDNQFQYSCHRQRSLADCHLWDHKRVGRDLETKPPPKAAEIAQICVPPPF